MKERRTEELIQGYLLGTIGEEEMEELHAILGDETAVEARRELRVALRMDSYLQEAAMELDRSRVAPPKKKPVMLPLALAGMAAALAFSVFAWFHQPHPVESRVASVIRVDGDSSWKPDDRLVKGQQVLIREGLLELAFRDTGVHLIGTAPLDLTIEGEDRIFLREGEIKLHVPPQGAGFVVETEDRKITDLGTRFVVKARNEESRILVLDGQISVSERGGGAEKLMGEGEVADFSSDRPVEYRLRETSGLPELTVTAPSPGTVSMGGRIFGFDRAARPFPELGYRDDWIGRQLLPLVASGFRDESCFAGLREGRELRFSGIAGSYNRFPERAGLAPFNRAAGWLAWYGGEVVPPEPGRYRFWGYADNHLLVAIGGRPVLDGSRFDSTFHDSLKLPRSNHPSFPCLNAPAGMASGSWVELSDEPLRVDILFGEVTGMPTSGILLIEREGEPYPETYWGQPRWPLFFTEFPTESQVGELERLRQHMEERLMGSFTVDESAVWKVRAGHSK